MKEILKLLSELSEKRQALNERILAEPNSETLEPARRELTDLEIKFREAVVRYEEGNSEPVPELPKRVELRNYMNAVVKGQRVTGAEAELNEERGLDTINTIPWDALLPLEDEEQRQDVATTVPASAIGHPQEPVLARIFKMSRMSFLGARMPTVGMGEPIYPVLTDGGSGAAYSPGGEADAEAVTFTSETVGPTRLSARYLWRMEDAVRFPVEEALRSDLRMVMSDLLDEQVFNGNGVAPNMNGLFRNDATGPLGVHAAETTKTDYDQVLTKVYNYVDGAAASSVGEVRTLIGVATNTFLATVREANGMTIFSTLGGLGAPTAVSAHVPDAVGDVQQAIQTRRGTDLVVPIWSGVTMIRDVYTGAAKAEVAMTAHFLGNLKLLRSGNWRKQAFKLA